MQRVRSNLMLLGAAAALNALVAWACVLWSPYTAHTKPSDEHGNGEYPATILGPDGRPGWWFTRWGTGVWECVPSGARGAEGEFSYWRGSATPTYFRAGWPMWSLQSSVNLHRDRVRWDLPAAEIFQRGIQTSWLPGWLQAFQGRRLPLSPLWLGFTVNTLVNSSILVLLWQTWIRIKTRRNRNAPSRVPA